MELIVLVAYTLFFITFIVTVFNIKKIQQITKAEVRCEMSTATLSYIVEQSNM